MCLFLCSYIPIRAENIRSWSKLWNPRIQIVNKLNDKPKKDSPLSTDLREIRRLRRDEQITRGTACLSRVFIRLFTFSLTLCRHLRFRFAPIFAYVNRFDPFEEKFCELNRTMTSTTVAQHTTQPLNFGPEWFVRRSRSFLCSRVSSASSLG